MVDDLARKLAQDPRNRIIKVAWSPLGGMLFLWVSWISAGKTLPPEGIAKVTGLPDPWKAFSLFDRSNDLVDPDKAFRKVPEGHSEPISDETLSKYLQWTPHDPISTQKDEVTPGDTLYYATTGLEFDDIATFNAPSGFADLCGKDVSNGTAQGAAFTHCNVQFSDECALFGIPVVGQLDGISGDRAVVAQWVASVIAWSARVGSPWPAAFSGLHVASISLSGTSHYITRRQQGVLILNIKKLRRYQSAGPGGKKADTLTFNVEANSGIGTWNLQAWTISAKVPPAGNGIRSFPLQDGDLHPDWDHNSSPRGPGTEPEAQVNFINGSDGPSVDVTLNFVTLKVTMKANGKTNPPKER